MHPTYMLRIGEAFLLDTKMSIYGGSMKKIYMSVAITISICTSICFANTGDHPGKISDDSALVAAVESHHNVTYVEAGNLTVTNLLPDDTSGITHQKWQAKLSNGKV